MQYNVKTGKQIKNRKEMSQFQVLKVLTPVVLVFFCAAITGLMGFCVQHQIGFYWSLIILLWGTILVIAGIFPYYINPHLPMLLGWAVWISVQSDYRLSRSTSYVAMFASNKWWAHMPMVCLPLLALVSIKKLQVLVLAVCEILYLAVIPKLDDVDEKIMVVQSILYCMLYFLSLGVSTVLSRGRTDMHYFVMTRMIGSIWILWIDDLLQMLVLSLIYGGFCLVTFIVHFETIQQLWEKYNAFHDLPATIENPEIKNK